MSKELPEVEDVVIVGPGSLLAEARIKQDISIDDVANRLNFTITLVKNIEANIFDKSISDTFNRGYLKNYAKLVNISISEVIERYEKLNIAEENQTKMQSFSNGTMKEAQNSMLMWITYLILTIFIGLTVMWWLQGNNEEPQTSDVGVAAIENAQIVEQKALDKEISTSISSSENENVEVEQVIKDVNEQKPSETPLESELSVTASELSQAKENETLESVNSLESNTSEATLLTQVVFSFSGDCWINIYDALGARIAWGVKKTGYVMTINAQTPLKITIGKPELVDIDFGGENVDMSGFPEGHIAKLTLPLLSQS